MMDEEGLFTVNNQQVTLHNADCLEVLPEIKDKSIDVIITNPPYHVGMTHNSKKADFLDLNMVKPFFQNLFFEYERILKKQGSVYIFTDWRTYPFLYPIFQKYFVPKNLL